MDLIEVLKTENLAFRRKLQSKSEALHILQSQLQACQQELEQRKGLGQLKRAQSAWEWRGENIGQLTQDSLSLKDAKVDVERYKMLEVVNKKLTDENKLLAFDLEDLKQKLNDANNDILMLRQESCLRRNPVVEAAGTSCTQHLDELEHLSGKCSQLEQDLQGLLDEKQDLIKQRDIYYDKMQRLNIQIRNLLNISNQNVDFDAIVMENKYLKQRLEDVLNEKKLWNRTVSKYKNMLSNNCQNTGKILSYDQIAKHLSTSKHNDQNNMRQICITLLETLNEKNLLLQHQRKTNKVLAARVLELESGRNRTWDVLLKGYSAGKPCEIDVENGRTDGLNTESDRVCSEQNRLISDDGTDMNGRSNCDDQLKGYTGVSKVDEIASSEEGIEVCEERIKSDDKHRPYISEGNRQSISKDEKDMKEANEGNLRQGRECDLSVTDEKCIPIEQTLSEREQIMLKKHLKDNTNNDSEDITRDDNISSDKLEIAENEGENEYVNARGGIVENQRITSPTKESPIKQCRNSDRTKTKVEQVVEMNKKYEENTNSESKSTETLKDKHIEEQPDKNNLKISQANSEMLKDNETTSDKPFVNDEDIQNLPIELQKLVLQAMKELDNDVKSL